MLKSKLNQLREKDGFTIIEVIIVLVIAAIIMLAVFLVVPQLQRTQRNSRAQTVGRNTLAAAEQYAANNGGTYSTTGTDISNISGVQKNGSNVTYGYSAITAAPAKPSLSTIYLIAAGTCTDNKVAAYTKGTGYVVAVVQEGATSNSIWCVSSR